MSPKRVSSYIASLSERLATRARKLRHRLGHYLIGLPAPTLLGGDARALHERLQQPGIECPRCRQLIPVDIFGLLSAAPVICPNRLCGLRLEVDGRASHESLATLQAHLEKLKGIQNAAAPGIRWRSSVGKLLRP